MLDSAGLTRFRAYVRQFKMHTTRPFDGKVVTQYPHDRSADRATDDFRKVALELFATWADSTQPTTVNAAV